MACRSLTARTCTGARVPRLAGRARAVCCSESRKIRTEHRGGGALLAGDASGQRSRTAGTASGFLLCSGLAVAGPRAPVAYCISTGQCVGRRSCLSMLDGHAWKPYLNLVAWARRRSPEAARWLTSLLTTDQVPFSARWPTGHGGMACLVAFVQGAGSWPRRRRSRWRPPWRCCWGRAPAGALWLAAILNVVVTE